MSDTMLLGVLNMPPDCWTGDPMDQSQRHAYYKEAAERIYKDGLRIAELEKSHARYEKLRRLDPRQFHSLWMQNIATGEKFDDLVDRLPS